MEDISVCKGCTVYNPIKGCTLFPVKEYSKCPCSICLVKLTCTGVCDSLAKFVSEERLKYASRE